MTFFQNHGEQVIQTMDEMSDFANQTVMTPTFLLVSIVFCFSTAVGAKLIIHRCPAGRCCPTGRCPNARVVPSWSSIYAECDRSRV